VASSLSRWSSLYPLSVSAGHLAREQSTHTPKHTHTHTCVYIHNHAMDGGDRTRNNYDSKKSNKFYISNKFSRESPKFQKVFTGVNGVPVTPTIVQGNYTIWRSKYLSLMSSVVGMCVSVTSIYYIYLSHEHIIDTYTYGQITKWLTIFDPLGNWVYVSIICDRYLKLGVYIYHIW